MEKPTPARLLALVDLAATPKTFDSWQRVRPIGSRLRRTVLQRCIARGFVERHADWADNRYWQLSGTGRSYF